MGLRLEEDFNPAGPSIPPGRHPVRRWRPRRVVGYAPCCPVRWGRRPHPVGVLLRRHAKISPPGGVRSRLKMSYVQCVRRRTYEPIYNSESWVFKQEHARILGELSSKLSLQKSRKYQHITQNVGHWLSTIMGTSSSTTINRPH